MCSYFKGTNFQFWDQKGFQTIAFILPWIHSPSCKISVESKKPELPPIDLHWFFEISIRTEKTFQLELKKTRLRINPRLRAC